jgi:hypothetical protein
MVLTKQGIVTDYADALAQMRPEEQDPDSQ